MFHDVAAAPPLHFARLRAALDHVLDARALLIVPALLYLLVLFLLPLASLIMQSFWNANGIDVSGYATFLGEPHSRNAIYNTLRFAVIVSLVCFVIGFPFAYVMARLTTQAQILILVLILLPMASSIVVRTFGWTILLRRDGLINELLLAAGLVERPIRLIFTEFGLVLGTVSMKLPLMILPIYSVLRQIPPDLMQSAGCLGATPAYAFRRVLLPLCVPGVIVGFAFVFAQTAAAYVVPSLLAGRRYPTMSTTIVDSYLVLQNAALGSAVSVLLLAIIVFAVAASSILARRWGGA